jgi:hypothetical protein
MRAVLAAKAFDQVQATQQVQMTKKVRVKKSKKAKESETHHQDDAKDAAPAEVMVVSSRPTSSRPISARRPSNIARFPNYFSRFCLTRLQLRAARCQAAPRLPPQLRAQ